MEMTLTQRAEEAEQAMVADEFRIIGESALAIFGWQDERYKRVLRLLEAGAALDAAMTLVPEGWHWALRGGADSYADMASKPYIETAYEKEDGVSGYAATPALALCAAALRARSAA